MSSASACSAAQSAFKLLEEAKEERVGLADLQDDDPAVFGMNQKADTLGMWRDHTTWRAHMTGAAMQRFHDTGAGELFAGSQLHQLDKVAG